ncbi:MAG: hypothetical protein L0207_02020 [Chlamydiae bacterium]|nr:hypothetical protein [Chlamydiota bacterium]
MAENIARSIAKILSLSVIDKENGLTPPPSLSHRRFPNRILIHPFSSDLQKNWTLSKFIELANRLKNKGFDPVFAATEVEAIQLKSLSISLEICSSLDEFATLVFESGLVIGNDSMACHLASNLKIPYIAIAESDSHMALWGPDWHPGMVVTPPK